LEERVGQVHSNESGSAGDEQLHGFEPIEKFVDMPHFFTA
jgi:hypothetical protein